MGRLFFSFALWFSLFGFGTVSQAAAETRELIHTLNLMAGIEATIFSDGSLAITSAANFRPLVTAEVVSLVDSRRRRGRGPAPFSTVVAEGALGGQRGFSARRDDDGDGAVDEDPLDGTDNDGDGFIDEDFAAISDAMVVVHQNAERRNESAKHLEYYHWVYPHLRSTVFLALSGNSGVAQSFRVAVGSQSWQEVKIVSDRHTLAGFPEKGSVTAFVGQWNQDGHGGTPESTLNEGAETTLWFGVVALEEKSSAHPVLDGETLEISVGNETLPVAICVARSWLQLNHMLYEATLVWQGVTDQITGFQASWIVPPQCAQCRLAAAPEFSWGQTREGDVLLTAEMTSGLNSALDPDLFVVNGKTLGTPREIRWVPNDGPAVNVSWQKITTGLLGRPDNVVLSPYHDLVDLLGHQHDGALQFVFPASLAVVMSDRDQISGSYLSGRPFGASLREQGLGSTIDSGLDPAFFDQIGAMVGSSRYVNQESILKSGEFHPTLSPGLLKGFPNPFRDVIQLRFQIPVNMGEAFVWNKGESRPAGLNLEARVPWQNGTPQVSVKIYSINGQELTTLFSASQGPGETTVQWAGTDNFGRQVASGTYFCKLQMDSWSVTRRLIYLR